MKVTKRNATHLRLTFILTFSSSFCVCVGDGLRSIPKAVCFMIEITLVNNALRAVHARNTEIQAMFWSFDLYSDYRLLNKSRRSPLIPLGSPN